jgi:hypothetical protein
MVLIAMLDTVISRTLGKHQSNSDLALSLPLWTMQQIQVSVAEVVYLI